MFQCNYDLKFLDLEGLPLFYRNILTVWQILHSKVPLSVDEIKEEIIGITALLRSAERRFFIKHGLVKAFKESKISSR